MQPRLDLTALSTALTATKAKWGSPADARVRVKLHLQGQDAVELAEIEVRKDQHPSAPWELVGYCEQVEAARRMVEAWQQEQQESRDAEGATVRNDVASLRAQWKKQQGK